VKRELVYKRDARKDRVRALLRLCPAERVCEIEKVRRGDVVYPGFTRKKSLPLAA